MTFLSVCVGVLHADGSLINSRRHHWGISPSRRDRHL